MQLAIFLPRDATRVPYMMSSCVCLSVRPSVTSQYCMDTAGRIGLGFWYRGLFIYPTVCYREIWVSPKVKVLPSEMLSLTLNFENFASASRWCCQQNSLTVELVDDTDDGRRVVAVYYMSVGLSTVMLYNPLLPLEVQLPLYNLFLQLC